MSLKTTVSLTPAQIEEAIKLYLEVEGFSTQTINFRCAQNYDHFDRPSGGISLSGADVQVTTKESK